jgi:hypothetical protein
MPVQIGNNAQFQQRAPAKRGAFSVKNRRRKSCAAPMCYVECRPFAPGAYRLFLARIGMTRFVTRCPSVKGGFLPVFRPD